MATELTSLSSCVQTFPYERFGLKMKLDIDIDAFTPAYFRKVRESVKSRLAALLQEAADKRERLITDLIKRMEESSQSQLDAAAQSESGIEEKVDMSPDAIRKRIEGVLPALPNADDATEHLEATARSIEIEQEINVELLTSGVLVGWDVADNGVPVPITREVFIGLRPKLVADLWEFAKDKSSTVKKKSTETNLPQTTSVNTGAGSSVAAGNGQPS